MVKRVGKYTVGEALGEGTYGTVKLATDSTTGKMYALKILEKQKIKEHRMDQQIKKEISVMRLLVHKHVVNLFEVLASENNIFLVIELVTGGELFDKIVAAGRLGEGDARKYFQQLLDGVDYCHKAGVAHRDLKPENLLLDGAGNLKISDFGLSSMHSDDKGRLHVMTTTCGTPNYVAPEVLSNDGYDGRCADVWSCGVILFVLLAGYLPFDEPTWPELFDKIRAADFKFPSWISSDAKDLIRSILVPNPSDRLSIEQIRKHHWFAEGYDCNASVAHTNYQPSEKEVTEAVSSFSVPQVEVAKVPKSEHSPQQSTAESKTVPNDTLPRELNAFDIIGSGMEMAGLVRAMGSAEATRRTKVMTELSPRAFFDSLTSICSALGITSHITWGKHKAGLSRMTKHGLITSAVIMYTLTDGVFLVEFRRGKGDVLEFHSMFRAIVQAFGSRVTGPSFAPPENGP